MNTNNKPIVVLLVMILVVQLVSLVTQVNTTPTMVVSFEQSASLPTLESGEYYLDQNDSHSFTLDVEDWAIVTVSSYDDLTILCDGYEVDAGWAGDEESCSLESGQNTITISEFDGNETYYEVTIETPEIAATLPNWEFDEVFALNGAEYLGDYLSGNIFAFTITDGEYEMTISGYTDLQVQDTYGVVTNYQGWDFTYGFEEGQYLVTLNDSDDNPWVEFNLIERSYQEESFSSGTGLFVSPDEEFSTSVSVSEESYVILSSNQDIVVEVYDMDGHYLFTADQTSGASDEYFTLQDPGVYQLIISEYDGRAMVFSLKITSAY